MNAELFFETLIKVVIAEAASQDIFLTKNLILSKTHKRHVTLFRFMIMNIMCNTENLDLNLQEIADLLNRKNHTTIIHGRDSHNDFLETNYFPTEFKHPYAVVYGNVLRTMKETISDQSTRIKEAAKTPVSSQKLASLERRVIEKKKAKRQADKEYVDAITEYNDAVLTLKNYSCSQSKYFRQIKIEIELEDGTIEN
jgi:hypothetical protein